MKKKIFSLVLAACTAITSAAFTVYADDGKVAGLRAESDAFSMGEKSAAKLFDGDSESAALLNLSRGKTIAITPEKGCAATKIRVAVKNFTAWQRIKTITVSAGGAEAELHFANYENGTQWAEAELDGENLSEIELAVSETYNIGNFTTAAIAEVELYEETEPAADDANEPREFELGVDFTIKAQSAALGGWEYALSRCFDHNSSTSGGLGDVTGGYIIYQFAKPTDVTKLTFCNVINGDWANPKTVRLKVYNEDVVYRAKLTNPEPVWDGTEYTLKNVGGKQEIELTSDNYKGITHLMVKFEDGYITGTGAKWGGWSEMEIFGNMHTDARDTAEIIATTLVSNAEILCDMGIIDNAPTDEWMNAAPNRLDMAKAILKMNGEYEKAENYTGTFNFADADDANYNILSYIYAYKSFGIVGDENNRFNPYDELTARAAYKMALGLLGYECGEDYTWEKLQDLCYKLGIGDMIYEKTLTNRDMCNIIYETFNAKVKGAEEYYVNVLYKDGKINDTAWAKISDKQDRVSPITDGDYVIPEDVDRNGDFTFTYNEEEHILEPAAFCMNTPHHYSGVYHGTLPADNPESTREEFGAALTAGGVRSMRFPGGLPAHQYFIEGEEYGIQLDQKAKRFNVAMGGLYDSDNPNDAWYVDFWDWLDFCEEYNIIPLFQMNPSCFVDEAGEVRQAYPCFYVKNTDAGLLTSPELYDHNRIDEAIAAFDKNCKEIKDRGYDIHYWEIGNEDNYKNYSSLPLTDPENPLTKDFIEAVTGYVRVINKYFPGSHIIVPGTFPYKEMMAEEDYKLLTAYTRHYPFGTWTIPPTNEKDSAARLAGTNEQNYVRNYSKEQMREDKANGKLLVDVTETMSWRFEGWNPNSLMHTFANALNMAHNWGEEVFDTGFVGVNVLHDLESPWFGSILYDVTFDPGNRYAARNESLSLTVHKDDVPDVFKFEDKYYFNPASRAFELMGRHVGGRVLTNSRTNVQRRISGYASVDGDEVRFTIVNRFNETIPVNIALSNISVSAQTTEAQILQSDYLRAILDEEYNNFTQEIEIKGNADNSEDNAVEFEAMPQSITHFTIKLDEITQ